MKSCQTSKTKPSILLWSNIVADNFFHTVQWLDICGRNGITLNPEPSKFRFCQNYVEFAGFEVTLDSVHPCKRFLEAITDFPSPKNITDVRSWFGLVHQASYTFSMADKMSPFSKLQTPGAKFARTKDLDDLFQETKVTIRREIENGIKIFEAHLSRYRLVKNMHRILDAAKPA